MHLIILVVYLLQGFTIILTSNIDQFNEELLIKPLYSDQLYVHFQFVTQWDVLPNNQRIKHTHLFPQALEEIIKRYSVKELHITLTGGLWRYESWGYPVIDAAPGTEIWAWFHEHANENEIDNLWNELSSSLSGLLCASLNFVHSSNSFEPKFSFRPRGVVNGSQTKRGFVRYAAFPREIVCTENLTPWKKLLPCGSKAGLASLLNSGYIHNARYHSLSLNILPICRNSECSEASVQLQQSMSLVYDYNILGTKNWSFRKLFGQGLLGPCPLSSNQAIFVDTTSNISVPYQLSPVPDDYITSIRGGTVSTFGKYHVKSQAMSINAAHLAGGNVQVNSPPSIHANQYITGFGQERGGITIKIFNNHWADLDVVLFQSTPWYVPTYLHTLKIINTNREIEPLDLKFTPGKQRERPYYLELLLRLPKKSTTTVSIDFDYVFLKWQEYPPDANHGFYINSATITAYLPLAKNFTGIPQDGATISGSFNASRSGYLVKVRTESIVITLPTPDFSMPYNVICLACTVVALAFGPLHNITTKRLILVVKDNESLLTKLKKKWFSAWKAKKTETTADE